MRKFIAGKLHGIHITDANLFSVELDLTVVSRPVSCRWGSWIWSKNSGTRISTYVIFGEHGSRCCILNGAAARSCQPGDRTRGDWKTTSTATKPAIRACRARERHCCRAPPFVGGALAG